MFGNLAVHFFSGIGCIGKGLIGKQGNIYLNRDLGEAECVRTSFVYLHNKEPSSCSDIKPVSDSSQRKARDKLVWIC